MLRSINGASRRTQSVNAASSCPVTVLTDTGGYYGVIKAATIYTKPISHETIDGHFCDVAVYVPSTAKSATIDHSTIKNAVQVGVLVQQATNVDLNHNTISYIGNGYVDPALYGDQFGLAVDFEYASGHLDHNVFSNYQKNGTDFYYSNVSFDHNVAYGTFGAPNLQSTGFDIIAQNGFEADYSEITEDHNEAYGNQYFNPNDAGGYNRGATGFLFAGVTTNGKPFTCADFKKDHDVAPSVPNPAIYNNPSTGNDIPFYAFPDYSYAGCP